MLPAGAFENPVVGWSFWTKEQDRFLALVSKEEETFPNQRTEKEFPVFGLAKKVKLTCIIFYGVDI